MAFFVDILTEKCQLVHKHIRESKDCLMILANITNTMATIKFYDRNLEDSQLLHVTISNLCRPGRSTISVVDRGAWYTV